MKLSPSQMKTVRHQFDSLCRKVLREESRNIDKQLARRAEKEISFSGLSEQELGRLYAMDDYPSDSTYFDVLDYPQGCSRAFGAFRCKHDDEHLRTFQPGIKESHGTAFRYSRRHKIKKFSLVSLP